jgi:hypothetical protein
VLFPTRYAPTIPDRLPARSAGSPGSRRRQIRKRVIRQVVVLEVAGRLSDAVEDLDRAILLALAEDPRGVVCDLSGVSADPEAVAVEVLATAGRHVRDWPGTPVGLACPHPQVRERLEAHPLGRLLMVTGSMFAAVSAVLATPTVQTERLTLAPHPTAQRASRQFVARILREWGLDRTIPFASAMVTELVASSSINAGTKIDLSIARDLGALRLSVRDHGPALPGQQRSAHLPEHALTAVTGLSRAFGITPTDDGGTLVWAVLDAPQRHLPPRNRQRSPSGVFAHDAENVEVITGEPEDAGGVATTLALRRNGLSQHPR